jgi:hypothetical protein
LLSHIYPPAPQLPLGSAPLKAVRLLLKDPDPPEVDARVRAASSREVGLVLDHRLTEGNIVAFLNRSAAAEDRRFLSAWVAHVARLGPQRWLVRCRFAVPLNESELRALRD